MTTHGGGSSLGDRGAAAKDTLTDQGGQVAGTAKDEAAQTASTAKEQTAEVAGTAKEQVQRVAGEASGQARNLAGELRGQVQEQTATQRDRLVGTLRQLGEELQEMADGGSRSGMASDLARQTAGRVREVGDYLDGSQAGDLLDDLRGFARRRPGTFLLGAAAAGVLTGRLTRGVKAATSSGGPDRSGTDVATSRLTGADPVAGGTSGYVDYGATAPAAAAATTGAAYGTGYGTTSDPAYGTDPRAGTEPFGGETLLPPDRDVPSTGGRDTSAPLAGDPPGRWEPVGERGRDE